MCVLVGQRPSAVTDSWLRGCQVAVMTKLFHENVVRLVEVINDTENDQLFLVIEYVSQGCVMNGQVNTDPLPLATARSYFRDLVCGLEYLHAQHVLHRDLKPANLLISSDGRLKVGLLGHSQRARSYPTRLLADCRLRCIFHISHFRQLDRHARHHCLHGSRDGERRQKIQRQSGRCVERWRDAVCFRVWPVSV